MRGNNNSDAGHQINPADGVDISNAEHFTFNLGGNSEFEVLLKEILSSNSFLRKILSYFDSGIVHLTFNVGTVNNEYGENAPAGSSYPSEESYRITFDSNYITKNGLNINAMSDNIGYDWSKVRSQEEALVVVLAHESLHAKHRAIYDETRREAGEDNARIAQYLQERNYNSEFIGNYLYQDKDGLWQHYNWSEIQDRLHDYMRKYDHGVINAVLEEYKNDHL